MESEAPLTLGRRLLSQIETTAASASFPLFITAAAVFIAASSSLLIYPEVAGSLNNKITTDRYDELALGIYHNGTLSFFPDPQPTVLRAPLYPTLLAAILALGEQFIPFSVQVVQALLHGLTCLLAYHIARRLCGARRAGFSSLLCAIHPYLLWYAGRMVIETVSVFLFTLIIFCVLQLLAKPTWLHAATTGMAIGAGILCKSTYFPFTLVVPLLLVVSRPRRVPLLHALLVLVVSLAAISPWIIRNHHVSGRWAIVQALTGYNFYVGDRFVERYAGSPLSYAMIIARTDFSKMDDGLPAEIRQTGGARREALQDEWLLSRSIAQYAKDPSFLLFKIAVNAVMFWTLGSTPPVSIFTMALQLPLLFFFIRSVARYMKPHGLWCPECIPVWLIATYFAIHLPVYALARFSVVFIPTMIAFAFLQNQFFESGVETPQESERGGY